MISENRNSQVPVVHACNPSCSGGRDQGDHSSKPALANSLRDPTLKNPIIKNWAGGGLKVEALSSIPSTGKKKRETETNKNPPNKQSQNNNKNPNPVNLSYFLQGMVS
jgi:hypothetical protein